VAYDDPVLVELRRFTLARDRLQGSVARRTGISVAEFIALDVLEAAGGPLTPRELGARVGLTSGAVTALADRLEKQGWLRRTPHPADRRSVLLELTPAAQTVAERELGEWAAGMIAAARSLSDRDARAVARFLAQVAQHTEDLAGLSPEAR
jgi:DNA-binding MarR family transcriptional regulator